MTIKLISVLHGSSNSGKSSTLRELCKLLSKQKDTEQIKLRKGNGKTSKVVDRIGLKFEVPEFGDFAMVIQIKSSNNTIVMGIGTGGDDPDILQRNFKLFEEYECDIVFCATKSTKSSIGYLYDEYLPQNKTAVVLPFFKFKANDNNKKGFNEQLAQRMLLVTKLQWNNLDKDNSQIMFN